MAAQAAQALGVDFYFCGAVFQKYELLGFIDASGNYQKTAFRTAYEKGGVFLFDELDASDSAAIVAFNAAIANGFCAFPDAIIKKHDDFYCIAAANTSGHGATRQYVGRNQLDAASLDRFVIIEVTIDEKIEELAVIAAFQSLCDDKNAAQALLALDEIKKLRLKAERLNVNCIISPRSAIDAAKLIAVGFDIEQALKASLFNKLDNQAKTQLSRGAM